MLTLASIAALQGSYGGTAYGVSKGAVLSLTYAVANELGLYGVRCNAVSPYSAATQETVRLLGEEFHELRKSGNPLHLSASPTMSLMRAFSWPLMNREAAPDLICSATVGLM